MKHLQNFISPLPIILFFLFSGCQSNSEKPGQKVFHYNQHNNITSLDPAFARSQNNIWSVHHLFSTLVQLDDDLRLVPCLAKEWSISDDGLIYTFRLRNDVLFHPDSCFENDSERILTASDVVYSFERLTDSELNAPGSWVFKDKVEEEGAFQAVDDSTFSLHLIRPFGPILSLLTMQYCSIVPKEAVDEYGTEYFRNPIGSGPYQFVKWVNNEGLFLKRYPAYFERSESDQTSNIEIIRTSFIGERSIALLELLNHRIDLFSGIESSYVNTVLDANGQIREGFENIRFIKAPYLNFEYFGINPFAPGAHPLLVEEDFRKALNYGIDRQLMLSVLRNNIGRPADAGAITRGLPSYDPDLVKGYHFDTEEALRLLKQFDQNALSQELTIHTSKDYLDLTTYVAKQWENIGLVTKIEVMESAALRDGMRRGQIPLFRASWIADYPDGESFLSMFYSQNPAPPNYTRFTNPEFDKLYELSLGTGSSEDRKNMYQSMDRILIEKAPVVFLFYDEVALFTSSELSGVSQNGLNLLKVNTLKKQ